MEENVARLVIDGKTVIVKCPPRNSKRKWSESSASSCSDDEKGSRVDGWSQTHNEQLQSAAMFGATMRKWRPLDLTRRRQNRRSVEFKVRTMVSNVFRQIDRVKQLLGASARGTVFDDVESLTASLLGIHVDDVRRNVRDDAIDDERQQRQRNDKNNNEDD